MSDYEMMNRRVAERKAARRKDTLRRLAFSLAIVLVVVLAFVGLECIGFISDLFMAILISIAVYTGAFHAGRIWNGFKR
jgi:1,4-dihydroxy-2-naphthoate octaprenyltransferase